MLVTLIAENRQYSKLCNAFAFRGTEQTACFPAGDGFDRQKQFSSFRRRGGVGGVGGGVQEGSAKSGNSPNAVRGKLLV